MTRGLALIVAALVALAPFTSQAQTTPEPKKDQPAKPAAPTVQLYGTLNVNTQWTRAKGLTSAQDVSPRLAVSTDSTNIGVRGGVQLTDWARAEFQCETAANVDGIGPVGICNRNSRIGLNTPVGLFWYGNWDTPYKAMFYGTKADDPFGNTDVYGFQGIMGSPGGAYRSSGWIAANQDGNQRIGGFDIRAGNSVGYWTPKFQGLSARLQYATNEFKSGNAAFSPKLYGAALIYDRGPFSVAAAYEKHEDSFALGGTTATGATSSDDWAWRVGAGYALETGLGTTRVIAAFEQLFLENSGGTVGTISDYDRFAWQVGLSQRIGAHEIRARFSMADEGDCEFVGGGECSTDEQGAKMLALGYAYHLAKTTQVYLHWANIMNDDNANYTFSIGGAPAVAINGATPGFEPQALGLGIRHAF